MNDRWLFPQSVAEAKNIQKEMGARVVLEDLFQNPSLIAGMDVSNTPFDPEKRMFGAVVLLSYPSLNIVERAVSEDSAPFPYIPGLLAFREAPVLASAYRRLARRPDLIMVDGHGISHPRKLGIASHLGVLLDVPTIGVAKSILIGHPESSLSEEAGSSTSLIWEGNEIGRIIRTKKNSSPLIISPGHKITLKTAVQWVMKTLKGYRLPETTRQAHLAANGSRRNKGPIQT